MGKKIRRRSTGFKRSAIEIACNGKEAFRLEEPAARDLRQPARTERRRKASPGRLDRAGVIDGPVAFAAARIVVSRQRGDPFEQGRLSGPVLSHDDGNRPDEGKREVG